MAGDDHGVIAAERALQAAQLAGDVAELDRLLHPDLLAVGADGTLVGKSEDLEAHRAAIFEIDELVEEDLQVTVSGVTAATFVVLAIKGRIAGEDASGRMRYTRTWVHDGATWRVLAAHISPVAD
jgi:ketosteroid isomerase-like protein